MAGSKKGIDGPVVIKKYANRRLYNTATSSYVTLEHLRDMVKEGTDFNVFDAKTGDDITRSVLAQIIFEEEGKQGQTMLPINFLRQLIQFYGDRLQAFVPSYLEASMEGLSKNAEQMRQQVADAFGGRMPFGTFEDLARQNVAMFQRAMRMFTPFRFNKDEAEAAPNGAGHEQAATGREEHSEIADLKAQLDAMRKQLDALATRAK